MRMNRLSIPILILCFLALSAASLGPCAAADKEEPKVKTTVEQPPLSDAEMQAAIKELRAKRLGSPIAGFNMAAIKGSFTEIRGDSKHNAADMAAPRNTPVLAVDNGVIVKLFSSKAGGLTIYQSEPSNKYVYYYAHLEKYAANLKDGDKVKKGQVIGYVGTSGNAPPTSPHLHFAVGLGDAKRNWWQTADVDPYEVFK